jgi:hypothetical protein
MWSFSLELILPLIVKAVRIGTVETPMVGLYPPLPHRGIFNVAQYLCWELSKVQTIPVSAS